MSELYSKKHNFCIINKLNECANSSSFYYMKPKRLIDVLQKYLLEILSLTKPNLDSTYSYRRSL